MKIISSVIAICLVMITVKLYTPEVKANPGASKRGIERIIESCNVYGSVTSNGAIEGYIDC